MVASSIGKQRFVIAASGTQVSHTGNTSETALANILLPVLGAGYLIIINCLWTFTNSSNNKTPRVRLHTATGTGGTAFMAPVLTRSATLQTQTLIINRGAANSQVGFPSNPSFFGGVADTSAVTTGAVDTSSPCYINITGQLASSGETIRLEGYLVEVIRA